MRVLEIVKKISANEIIAPSNLNSIAKLLTAFLSNFKTPDLKSAVIDFTNRLRIF